MRDTVALDRIGGRRRPSATRSRFALQRVAGAVGRRVGARAQSWLRSKALRNPRYSTLFYFLEGSFDRELHSVLAGKEAHVRSARSGDDRASLDAATFTLRRNTHRIEKGLLMRPRRDVFATSYIGETVDAYRTASPSADADLVRWSTDVLDEYFDVVSDEGPIQDARLAYGRVRTRGGEEREERRIPYLRDTAPLPVTIEDFEALAHRRRSVRWFRSEPVPRAAVDRALAAALQSPSACNRQPFQFRIFDDPALVSHVAEVPMGTSGYVHNIPAVAVIVGRQRAYFSERDRHLIYVDSSLAAMSFMFALEVQGIASCPINWPDIPDREARMAEMLGLDADERPVMLVAFGYPDPDGAVAYSQKKSISEARTYNEAPGASLD